MRFYSFLLSRGVYLRHFLQKCRISPLLSQPELQRVEIDVILQDLIFGDFGRRKIPALLQHWWGGTEQGTYFKPRAREKRGWAVDRTALDDG
ncbi:hypothetical protein [Paenibacillus dendritiformis]|nr:hypothetical protein [Paenibacillus dendritiformis]CAH8768336.1 hypothetical protein H7S4_001031 [Paenibacillus dendritiformis]